MDENQRENAGSASMWDIVTTQAGLLSSRSLAERVAQDLNLAANRDLVGTEGDAATRLRTPPARSWPGSRSRFPKRGS